MHSLAFRVMRLCQPDLPAEHVLGLDLSRDFLPDDLATHVAPLSGQVRDCIEQYWSAVCLKKGTDGFCQCCMQTDDQVFASRAHTQSPACEIGTHGFLKLPQSFGSIFLGENFASYISVGNYASQAVRNVVIKVHGVPLHGHSRLGVETVKHAAHSVPLAQAELQSGKAKVLLYDTSPSPLAQLLPGDDCATTPTALPGRRNLKVNAPAEWHLTT